MAVDVVTIDARADGYRRSIARWDWRATLLTTLALIPMSLGYVVGFIGRGAVWTFAAFIQGVSEGYRPPARSGDSVLR